MGVVLGVRDATGVTTKILHDVVAGAIQGGKGRDIENASVRGAAEGTMQVANSVGIPPDQAVSQISRAIVEALKDSEEELIEGAKATIKGIIAGTAISTENVLDAARLSGFELVYNAAGIGFADLGSLATAISEAAAEVGSELSLDAEGLANAASEGCLKAADEVSDSAGDAVRFAMGGKLNGV